MLFSPTDDNGTMTGAEVARARRFEYRATTVRDLENRAVDYVIEDTASMPPFDDYTSCHGRAIVRVARLRSCCFEGNVSTVNRSVCGEALRETKAPAVFVLRISVVICGVFEQRFFLKSTSNSSSVRKNG